MKKSYLLAAAVTMLTACTNNERLTNDLSYDGPVMIGFETFHEKTTKATGEITAPSNLTIGNGGFGVWGYKGAPDDIVEAAVVNNEGPAIVNINDESKYTSIFNNVKVWWKEDINYTQNENNAVHSHFTYAVPKYWDKGSEYIFFAYAPYDASNAELIKNKGNIKIKNIPSIQDISASSGSAKTLKFSGTENKTVTDYLMATYVTNQKYSADPWTNQHGKSYTDAEQTVGFTFGHMLSKLTINLEAYDQYEGIEELSVNSLSIENMPAKSADKTIFTQTSPTGPAGIYDDKAYTSELLIIKDNAGENEVVTSNSKLYILTGGKGLKENGSDATTVDEIHHFKKPDHNKQDFNYYVAPNDPNENSNVANKKYLANLNYTIKYVDGTTEDITVSDIDITTNLLTKLEQNYYYILTIKIKMNQILFTVDRVIDWAPRDPNTEAGNNNTQAIEVAIN
ncbi:MAG: fimbrillin family protein [Bacteroidaceae bacterium]|nr:fimbrillin family protein [Bacteroidaceae bacterium]